MTTQTPTLEQIETLRDLFLKKLEKDGAPCEDGFHPDDIERVKTSDRWLQLFLEQLDLDMKQALNMLWETCLWRKTYGTNELSEKSLRIEYLESGIFFPHNKDLDGKKLLIFKSKLHTKGTREVSELIKCLVYWIERIQRETNFDQMTLFFDMQSAGMSNMDMDFIKRIIDTFKLYYPNSLNYIIIYEMPWILNAAFKIIKGILPPKAVQRMKFVNSKTMKEVISEDNMLKSWGGTDGYEFKFVPENREQISASKASPQANIQTNHGQTNGFSPSPKKVHFANPSPPESPMTEMQGVILSGGSEGELLRLKPDDAIVFVKSGTDLVGSVHISNVAQSHVSYKVKTTSPDKFRVRPSAGTLIPGGKSTINVILQQGHELSAINKDKFLVMCMAISEEIALNEQAITELWRSTPSSSSQVEQHRLRCSLPQTVPGDGVKNGRLNAGGMNSSETDRQISHFNTTLSQLTETAKKLEQQVRFTQTLQWLTLIIFLVLAGLLAYVLKFDLLNAPESPPPDCVIKNSEL